MAGMLAATLLGILLMSPRPVYAQLAEQNDASVAEAAAKPLDPRTGAVLREADDEAFLLGDSQPAPTISDPIEPFNRSMFWFNDKLYFYALKPAAQLYSIVVFTPFRQGINNAFHNIRFPMRFANCLLQGKVTRAGQELGRFLLNSTFGIGGLFRVSDGVEGLNPADDEDTDQTLATYGMGHGFYIVWPVLGPSSPRATAGYAADHFLDPLTWILGGWGVDDDMIGLQPDQDVILPWAVAIGERVNRASLSIGAYEALKRDSIDPYLAMRDAFVQYSAAHAEK